ncbi:hypothetical protein E4T50_13532 [Aureobasidium sp. EXF-12298]|nr:hypothetical protein E4T50_13532 [Aureobasidium sp. EXF-12298]KAI4751598.1 hypothetical protein E4T51_15185 [Aureobasidium sp. EXF-12344]KAI4770852.1 hypothetical protein E4T52_14139 [Aureobasidium sp. EXF-3400]
MSAQMPRERLRGSDLEGSTSLTRDLDDHQQRYPELWDTPTIPIFHFLDNLASETSIDTRLKYLQVLLPNTEMQVEYLLDPDSGPDDMAEEFGISNVAPVLMQHINTVTFSMSMKEPSTIYVTAHFDGNGRLLRTEVDSIGLEDAYDRLDREYIELEINKRVVLWTEVWKPTAMNCYVIELMATDLRRTYQRMVDIDS